MVTHYATLYGFQKKEIGKVFSMSTMRRLDVITQRAQKARILVNEVRPDMQIDRAGMRALSDEIRMRVGRNTSARNASVRSAASTTTGW